MPIDNKTKQDRWAKLIRVAEQVGYGNIEIKVQEGVPIMAEVVVKKIKLDGESGEVEQLLKTIGL